MTDDFEAGPGWAEKTGFLPGLPEDLGELPTLHYQALLGNVYTLQRWPNGSTVRGEVGLDVLQALVGGPVREGWYDAAGVYVGASLSLD